MKETMMEASVRVLHGHKYKGKHSPKRKDFKHIGDGCYREVYLSKIDGHVYKTEPCKDLANPREFAQVERLNKTPLPDGVRMPKTWLIELPTCPKVIPTIVMEYIPFTTPLPRDWDYDSKRTEMEDTLGVHDLHDENIRYDKDGMLVPIDLGDCWMVS